MKKGIRLLPAAVLLIALLLGGCGRNTEPEIATVTVQGVSYPVSAESLELKDPSEQDLALLAQFPELKEIHITGITDSTLADRVSAVCPKARLTGTVLLDGTEYDLDTRQLTLSHLTEETVLLLDLLPGLETVEAWDCTDYEQLVALWDRRPELDICYEIPLCGETYGPMTQFVELKNPSLAELQTGLAWLPYIWTVDMEEPEGTPEELQTLLETYPEVEFSWSKTVREGFTLTSGTKEVDFSGIAMTVEEAKTAMDWLPGAEKVILSGCGISNEALALLREEKREQYKVVWTVEVIGLPARTDDAIFHYSAHQESADNFGTYTDLVYCEEMVIVDLGHSNVADISWVSGMPELKYLILADTRIEDLSPLRTCKNLIYLELHVNYRLQDLTPLLECTALQDLNLSQCQNVDLTPLAEMTWLKTLWLRNIDRLPEQFERLRASLPDARVEYGQGSNTAYGWRDLQNYFDMREMMGLSTNPW